MSNAPKSIGHRYLLSDAQINPDEADKARKVLAGIAAEHDDPCGLVVALEALGLIEEDCNE